MNRSIPPWRVIFCRCTGYAPIINAAQQSLSGSRSDHFAQGAEAVLVQLQALQSAEMLATSRHGRTYFAPTTMAELCALLEKHPGATILAGATDVGLWVTKQLQATRDHHSHHQRERTTAHWPR